jgi:hypothetical protein
MRFLAFRNLKMKLEGMLFDTPAAGLAEVEEKLGAIRIPEWIKVFGEWKGRLEQYSDVEGEDLSHD